MILSPGLGCAGGGPGASSAHDGPIADGGAGERPPRVSPDGLFADPSGGARLKPITLHAPDGPRVFTGWHDTALATPCAFAPASDGSLRCLPDAAFASALGYADPECRTPLQAFSRDACELPGYLALARAETCPQTHTFLRRKAKLDQARYYVRSGATCVMAASPLPSDVDAHEMVEVSPDAFVRAEVKPGTPAGGFVPTFIEAEDGARGFRGWRDDKSGLDCLFATAADGATRCLPVPTAFVQEDTFADGTCATPAAGGERSSCTTTAYAAKVDAKTCPVRMSVFRGGPRLSRVYQSRLGGCAAVALAPGTAFYAIAEELPPSSFAAASPGGALAGGTTRLVPAVSSTPAGAARIGSFFDEKLGRFCRAEVAGDGVLRCLPFGNAGANVAFADAACAVALADGPASACVPALAQRLERDFCPVRRRIFRIAQPHSGQVYVVGARGCTLIPVVIAREKAFYALGAEILPEEFVAVTRVTP